MNGTFGFDFYPAPLALNDIEMHVHLGRRPRLSHVAPLGASEPEFSYSGDDRLRRRKLN